jgi:hypothetical protein
MQDAPRQRDEEDASRRAPAAKDVPSDVAAIVDDENSSEGELDPRRAYEVLEIRTPFEEFDAYVRARIDTLSRLGEADKAELAAQALELGRRALARVTGTTLAAEPKASREEPPRA